MCLLLLLVWCSGVIGYRNSRFGGFNSRLGRKFPATGICGSLLNSAAVFVMEWRLDGQNRNNSHYHAKNRDCAPAATRRLADYSSLYLTEQP